MRYTASSVDPTVGQVATVYDHDHGNGWITHNPWDHFAGCCKDKRAKAVRVLVIGVTGYQISSYLPTTQIIR